MSSSALDEHLRSQPAESRVDSVVVGRREFSELWVCFESPIEELPPHCLVLSFVAPGAEEMLERRWPAQVVSGRSLVQGIRPRARAEYVELIARVGATACFGGRTLRQVLQGPGNYSRWWFLDVTEKDCLWDEDVIYLTILRLMAVQTLKKEHGIERVRLYCAPPAFGVAFHQRSPSLSVAGELARALATGLAGRLTLLVEHLVVWWTLRRRPGSVELQRDVLLQGYWDWSVGTGSDGSLRDRYFTDLPRQLAKTGLRVGWLASCELSSEARQRGRKRRDVAAESRAHPEIALLESYITLTDILRSVLNVRYSALVTRFALDRRFRRLCRAGGGDVYPLVRRQLLRSAWGQTLCRLQLVAAGTARACRQLRPKLVLTSFELLLRSRALYVGVRAATPRVCVWAAQHAGYSSDKTLGIFDPSIEFRGEPDGCAMPAPDGLFAMGDLSRRIWERSGFSSERVVVTGGLRYQAVRIEPGREEPTCRPVTLLLAGGMCEAAHVDLCDAVVSATSGLESVRLLWRDHPLYRLSERPAFSRFRETIAVTSGTQDDDFRSADLVVFSQTGLAEEALLRGLPTWQWLWAGFNTSPFLDVPVIPSFTSVSALRDELRSFVHDPAPYRPSTETQQRVIDECFGSDPAGASARIADAIRYMISSQAGAHA